MRGDDEDNGRGHRNNKPGREHGKGKPLFRALETGTQGDNVSLLGMGNGHPQSEGAVRRILRAVAQGTDIFMALIVMAYVIPVTDMSSQNIFGYILALMMFLLSTSTVASLVRRTRIVTNVWVGIRSLFYVMGLLLTGSFVYQTYQYSLNADGTRDPLPAATYLPFLVCFMALILSFVSFH